MPLGSLLACTGWDAMYVCDHRVLTWAQTVLWVFDALMSRGVSPTACIANFPGCLSWRFTLGRHGLPCAADHMPGIDPVNKAHHVSLSCG